MPILLQQYLSLPAETRSHQLNLIPSLLFTSYPSPSFEDILHPFLIFWIDNQSSTPSLPLFWYPVGQSSLVYVLFPSQSRHKTDAVCFFHFFWLKADRSSFRYSPSISLIFGVLRFPVIIGSTARLFVLSVYPLPLAFTYESSRHDLYPLFDNRFLKKCTQSFLAIRGFSQFFLVLNNLSSPFFCFWFAYRLDHCPSNHVLKSDLLSFSKTRASVISPTSA